MKLSDAFGSLMGTVRSNIEEARATLSRIGPIPGGPTHIAIAKLDAALKTLDRDYEAPAEPAPLAPDELRELLGRMVLDGVRAAGIPLASWEDMPPAMREGFSRAGRAAWEDGWQYGYSDLRVAMGAPGETPDGPAVRGRARGAIGDKFAHVWLALTHANVQARAGASVTTMLSALSTIETRVAALDCQLMPVIEAVARYKRARLRGMSGEDCALDMQACVGDMLRGLGAHMIPPDGPPIAHVMEWIDVPDKIIGGVMIGATGPRPIGVKTTPTTEAPRVVQVLTLDEIDHFGDPARWTVGDVGDPLTRAQAVDVIGAGHTMVQKEAIAIKLVSMEIGESWSRSPGHDLIVRVA